MHIESPGPKDRCHDPAQENPERLALESMADLKGIRILNIARVASALRPRHRE